MPLARSAIVTIIASYDCPCPIEHDFARIGIFADLCTLHGWPICVRSISGSLSRGGAKRQRIRRRSGGFKAPGGRVESPEGLRRDRQRGLESDRKAPASGTGSSAKDPRTSTRASAKDPHRAHERPRRIPLTRIRRAAPPLPFRRQTFACAECRLPRPACRATTRAAHRRARSWYSNTVRDRRAG